MVETQKQLPRLLIAAVIIMTCATIAEFWRPGLVRHGLPLLWLWFALVAVIMTAALRASSGVGVSLAQAVLLSSCVGGILTVVAGIEFGALSFFTSLLTVLLFIL